MAERNKLKRWNSPPIWRRYVSANDAVEHDREVRIMGERSIEGQTAASLCRVLKFGN